MSEKPEYKPLEWEKCTKEQAEAIIKRHDLVGFRHGIGDCDLWFVRGSEGYHYAPWIYRSWWEDVSPETAWKYNAAAIDMLGNPVPRP